MFLEMTSIRKHNLIFFQFYSQKGDGAPPPLQATGYSLKITLKNMSGL